MSAGLLHQGRTKGEHEQGRDLVLVRGVDCQFVSVEQTRVTLVTASDARWRTSCHRQNPCQERPEVI